MLCWNEQKKQDVRTMLQSVELLSDGNKVETRKQRSAFPPNYIHSVDSSHMMMTATACKRAGVICAAFAELTTRC